MMVVTGAGGCVGSHVARALVERGEQVRIGLLPGEVIAPGHALHGLSSDLEVVECDVRDADGVRRLIAGAASVFHLAAVAGLASGQSKPMWDVNVNGTRNIIRAAREQDARLVHTSTIAAVGRAPAGLPADEGCQLSPADARHPYPLTKHVAEMAVLEAAQDGLDAVVINPGPVLATGGDPRNTWCGLVLATARGQLPFAPPGSTGVLTQRDLVQVQLAAHDRGRTGERYIATSENVTFAELLTRVRRSLGIHTPARPMPALGMRAVTAASVLRDAFIRTPAHRSPLNFQSLAFHTEPFRYDNGKARRELGLQPTDTTEALDALVDWCDAQGLLPNKFKTRARDEQKKG